MTTIPGVGGAQILQKVTNKDQLGLFTPSSAVVLQIAFAFGLGKYVHVMYLEVMWGRVRELNLKIFQTKIAL